ncbi:MAG: ATP-binding protein [Lachnospiraceae bacterium]|nr:ATP-binding protein [Lachnospiraceae bacterium]
MVARQASIKITDYTKKFPIVTVTGVRQCGKTTMLRSSFPEYGYVSLEDADIREFAMSDPRGFLQGYETPCIIDEIQRVPELFSYLQTKVDNDNVMGEYILSGSHNFLLMEKVSQSLAGRTAVFTLAPFSISELSSAEMLCTNADELMLKGFYPAIYNRSLSPDEYFPSYIRTYIERDVRLIKNITDADGFTRFVRLLAARSGQTINHTDLSNACGISVPTVRAWLSVLRQSFIVFELMPYYRNYSKRLVKTPKLYFYDTGLLCHMLGIETKEQLSAHPLRGAVFETMVISEYMKSRFFKGKETAGYFWRDTNQNEVDLLTEDMGELRAYEIKSGKTMNRKFFDGLYKFSDISGIPKENLNCILDIDRSMRGEKGNFIRYTEAF